MIERTLILIKPDGIQRSLTGEVISRFEKVGLKIVGMKMMWVDKKLAGKHYGEDIIERRGEFVRNKLINFLSSGPIIAFVLEGLHAVEVTRKICGETEPKIAQPGTIRGDYCHGNFEYSDNKNTSIKNIVHASSNKEEAEFEINLWFKPEELHSYKTVHDEHVY